MRRVPSFVHGHVIGALVCWWWPRFDAPAWKLWLVATVAYPVLIAGLAWSGAMRDCLIGALKGWSCLFAEVGLLAAAATLPSSVVGLIVRRCWARWRPRWTRAC